MNDIASVNRYTFTGGNSAIFIFIHSKSDSAAFRNSAAEATGQPVLQAPIGGDYC